MSTFEILFDWWRGDNGVLPEGIDLPSMTDRDRARRDLLKLTEEQIDLYVQVLVKDRHWFRGMPKDDPEDFRQWLDEMRSE